MFHNNSIFIFCFSIFSFFLFNFCNSITSFLEKPALEDTDSRLGCPPLYIYTQGTLSRIQDFLDEHAESPLKEKDSPGRFLRWLSERTKVYAHPISGRFDVGNLPQYIAVNEYFNGK